MACPTKVKGKRNLTTKIVDVLICVVFCLVRMGSWITSFSQTYSTVCGFLQYNYWTSLRFAKAARVFRYEVIPIYFTAWALVNFP